MTFGIAVSIVDLAEAYPIGSNLAESARILHLHILAESLLQILILAQAFHELSYRNSQEMPLRRSTLGTGRVPPAD